MRVTGAPFLVLGIGVLAASASSVLVRYAQDAGIASIAIAAWRMVIASLLLLPFALGLRLAELRAVGGRSARIAMLAGVFLALHFAAWITSLEYTSVASSAALVTTNPVWVGLATVFVFRERLARLSVLGIVISLAGCLLILWADLQAGEGAAGPTRQPLLGNGLALLGAVCISAYLLTGRQLAARLSLLGYVTLVYGMSAVVLVAMAVASGAALWGFPAAGWLAVAGLAIGPQLVGHSAFNWALRRLSPTFVALSILGEPVGSALLAGLLFGEIPGAMQWVAFGVLLAGIVVASLGEQSRAG